jgi:hypothetical protein
MFPTVLFKSVASGLDGITLFLDSFAEALGVLGGINFDALCQAIHFDLCLFIHPFECFVDRVFAVLTGHTRHFEYMFHGNAPKIRLIGVHCDANCAKHHDNAT